MAQEILRQVNFNGGELSPQAVGRRDLKAYVSSLALALNMLATSEGPIRRRPGLRHVDLIRNRLEPSPFTEAMLSAPNGGDVADLAAGSGFATTTPMEAVNPYVVVEIDFGAPVEIGLVDLIDFAVVAPGSGGGGGEGGGLPAPPQFPWEPLRPDNITS